MIHFLQTSTYELILSRPSYIRSLVIWWKNPAFSVLPGLTSGDILFYRGFCSNLEKRLSQHLEKNADRNPTDSATQRASLRSVSEATSDGSADSGIALRAAVNSPLALDGVSCRPNDTTDNVDGLEYDVPVAGINGSERQHLDVVDVRRHRSDTLVR